MILTIVYPLYIAYSFGSRKNMISPKQSYIEKYSFPELGKSFKE
jgi:hypothetical protein